MCQPKEPFHFCSDMPGLQKYPDEADYLGLFAEARPNQTRIGEASAIYLYSTRACPRILSFDPDARLIVMLRDPVELVESYHAQQLIALNEDVVDLETAWDLQQSRAEGRNIPKFCADPKLLAYRDIASLGAQVDRLLAICPRSQVHFVLFEDLKADTAGVYAGVLEFLGLKQDGRRDFSTHNMRSAYRSGAARSLREALAKSPRLEQALISASEKTRLKGVFQRALRKPAVTMQANPKFLAQMHGELAPDVKRLSGLIDRDLDHWIRPETLYQA